MDRDLALQAWIDRWRLTPDGAAFITESTRSHVQPVLTAEGQHAVLKVATTDEERRGAAAMEWWAGQGTARVLARSGAALLLERLSGEGELQAMAARGGADDDAATEILCRVALRMHRVPGAEVALSDLERWFSELHRAADTPSCEQPLFTRASRVAKDLFSEPAPAVALHGDMHHGNALRSTDGAWVAIDPKGLLGDPGYDFANILNNPNAKVAHAPGRLGRQARIIAACSGQPLPRVLKWAFAYAALSAAWSWADGREDSAALALTTARIAQAELAAIA